MKTECSVRRLIFLLFAALAVQGQNPEAKPVASPVKSSPLSLEGRPRAVSPKALTQGHAGFQLESGTADRVLQDGKPIGFFFVGSANFTYSSEFAMEFPALRHNLKENHSPFIKGPTNAEPNSKTLDLSTPVHQMLLVGLPSDFLEGRPPSESLEKAFLDHTTFFDRPDDFSESWPYDHPLNHDLACQAANNPGARLVVAQMRFNRSLLTVDRLIYRFDDAWQRVETLGTLNVFHRGNEAYTRLIPISRQPIGWTLKEAPYPDFLLSHVEMKLTEGKDEAADLRIEETVTPMRPVRVLPFNLLSVIYRSVKDGMVGRTLTIRSITDSAGNALSFSHHRDELLVDLGKTVAANQSFKLQFRIEGHFLHGSHGYSYWELGTEAWFPQPLQLEGHYYTLKADIATLKPRVPVSSGTRMQRSEDETHNRLHVEFDHPVQFFCVFGGKYKLSETKQGDQTVRIATYAEEGGNEQKLTGLTFGLIDFYQSFLGPFPFKDFQYVQVPYLGYGQAPPGLVILTSEAFRGKSDYLAGLYSQGINQRIAHELAHQYWGHVVKMPSLEEQWITETFAEYCSALAMRMVKSQGDSAFDSLLATWKRRATEFKSVGPIPLANQYYREEDYSGAQQCRYSQLYCKGPLILNQIRVRLGDQLFLRFLNLVQQKFAWRFATTEDLRKFLEGASRQDYRELFEQCYWGMAVPKE